MTQTNQTQSQIPNQHPRAAVAIFIVKKDTLGHCWLLMGKRNKQPGFNQWALPGGKVDFGEGIREAAARELKEETGILIDPKNLDLMSVQNLLPSNETSRHYVDVCYIIEVSQKTEAILREPEKCQEWKWFNLDTEGLPADTWNYVVEAIKEGFLILAVYTDYAFKFNEEYENFIKSLDINLPSSANASRTNDNSGNGNV